MTLEASSSGPALVTESGSCRSATVFRRDSLRLSRRGAKAQESKRSRRARGSIASSFDFFVAEIRSKLWLPLFFMGSANWLERISGSHRRGCRSAATPKRNHRKRLKHAAKFSKLQEKFDGWVQSE